MAVWSIERRQELCRKRREVAQKRRAAPPPNPGGTVGDGVEFPPDPVVPIPTTTKDIPMTATDNRHDPDMVYDLPRTKVVRLIEDLETAKQRQSDANTAHMSEWKAAKEAGAPVESLKLCMKLDRMSSDKRRDFLRGFDELRAKIYGHWDQQPDLFVAEQPDAQAAAEEDHVEVEDRDDTEDTGTVQVAERAAPSEPDAAQELSAGGDDKGDGSSTGAVAAFNDGRKAGRSGADVGTNPHSGRSAVGKSWRKGWDAGASDLEKIKLEGAEARRAGKGMEVAPYISDTDPAGAKAWAVGWWTENERLKNAAVPAGTATEIDGVVYLPTTTH